MKSPQPIAFVSSTRTRLKQVDCFEPGRIVHRAGLTGFNPANWLGANQFMNYNRQNRCYIWADDLQEIQ